MRITDGVFMRTVVMRHPPGPTHAAPVRAITRIQILKVQEIDPPIRGTATGTPGVDRTAVGSSHALLLEPEWPTAKEAAELKTWSR